MVGVGAAGLFARNWLWGDAGYSVEARQPIMFLAITLLTLGATSVQTSIRGTTSQARLMAGVVVVLVATTPLVIALNVAGWDRFYNRTNWPLPYVTTGFAVLVGFPTVLAYLALRKVDE